jgi:hypothetical protein
MYQTNRRIADSDGVVNNRNPHPQGHHTNPSNIIGTYQSTAGFFGEVLNRQANIALQSSMLHAREEMRRGTNPSINASSVREQFFQGAATDIVEQFTRDGPHAAFLNATTAAAGIPSTFTTLRNGDHFDSRSIATCNQNYRASNNQLVPRPSLHTASRTRVPPGTSKRLFPPGVLEGSQPSNNAQGPLASLQDSWMMAANDECD